MLALLTGGYWTARHFFYRRLIFRITQDLLDEFATAKVEKVGRIVIDSQGDITLYDTEVFTYRDGNRRLFYRAPQMLLSVDGFPGRDRKLRLMRVDLVQPEIWIRREQKGEWNVEWAFRKAKRDGPPGSEAGEGPGPPDEGFPKNGIHIHDGIVHVTTVGRSGHEVTWTITKARGVLSKEQGVLRLRPFEGEFYGGRLVADAEVPRTEPFTCDFQITVTGAEVSKLAERLVLARPVSGRLDGVLVLTRSADRTQLHNIAAGQIQITNGDLWELPVFLSILSVLALDPGFDRRIESAEVKFTVEEDRIRIDQMDFLGSALCLFGDGEMDLDGENLEVVFIPRLGKNGMGDIIPLFGTPIQWLLDLAKGVLLPVVMTGSFDRPQVSVKPGYIIATPVRKLIESKSPK